MIKNNYVEISMGCISLDECNMFSTSLVYNKIRTWNTRPFRNPYLLTVL